MLYVPKPGAVHQFARSLTGELMSFHGLQEFIVWLEWGISYAKQVTGLPTASIVVTPPIARHLLTRNKQNRRISPQNVTGMKVDIVQGAWKLSPDPLVISDEGELISGQHRLAALLDTHTSLGFNITFGISYQDAVLCLDRGQSRTPSQVIAYTCHVPNHYASILRSVWFSPSVHERKLTSTETKEMTDLLLPRTREIWTWLEGCPRKLKPAAMVAALVRSSFHVPLDKLEHFCTLYREGPTAQFNAQYEKVVLALRESILTEDASKQRNRDKDTGSSQARKKKYLRTTTAVKAFMAAQNRKIVRQGETDWYPLVAEAAACKRKWDELYDANRFTTDTMHFVLGAPWQGQPSPQENGKKPAKRS